MGCPGARPDPGQVHRDAPPVETLRGRLPEPAVERPIDRAIAGGTAVVHVCRRVDDTPRDPIGDVLADALLRAVTAGDFDTASRVKAKLDDWRRGRT